MQQVIGEITNRGVCALRLDPMLKFATPLTTYHFLLTKVCRLTTYQATIPSQS